MNRNITILSVLIIFFVIIPHEFVSGEETRENRSLREILKSISRSKNKTLKFVETKVVHSLGLKLKSSGTYFFRSPQIFEKITENPAWERVLIKKNSMSIENENGTDILYLQQHPSLRIVVDSIRSVFVGNFVSLRDTFEIKFLAHGKKWSFQLTPKQSAFEQAIQSVIFSGIRSQVSNIRINQFDGDEILISFQ